jgi:hypothetical protein
MIRTTTIGEAMAAGTQEVMAIAEDGETITIMITIIITTTIIMAMLPVTVAGP